jgi:hypothetical protein
VIHEEEEMDGDLLALFKNMAKANEQSAMQVDNRRQLEEMKQEVLQRHQGNYKESAELAKKFQESAHSN